MKKFSNESKLDQVINDFLKDMDCLAPATDKDGEVDSSKIDSLAEIDIATSADDGLISIQNGKLEVVPPKPGGKPAIIKAGENVVLEVDGKEVTGAFSVMDTQSLKIVLRDQHPISEFFIQISPEGMEVIMETEFSPGKKYFLLEAEAQHLLIVQATQRETVPPRPIIQSAVYAKLRQAGVSVGIISEAISTACSNMENTKTVIAKGKRMMPPIDGWIKYTFESAERVSRLETDQDKVDYFDKGEIPSVEAGQILAIRHAPVPGRPGMTVTGQTVLPPEPKSVEINPGPGVELADNGQMAIATQAGRPVVLANKGLRVIPELIINNDVSITTGHINFRGDVIIMGSVLEGLTVNAGGKVRIMGSVYHATVYGGEGIEIKKNVIGGFVCAGGEAAQYRNLLPYLEKIDYAMKGVIKAYKQLSENSRFSTEDLRLKGPGNFIKIVLEVRFPHLSQTFNKLQKIIDNNNDMLNQSSFFQVIQVVAKRLVGFGPMEFKSFEEFIKMQQVMINIIQSIHDSNDSPADVSLSYSQNSNIIATGKVSVLGKGTYLTRVSAGSEVILKGCCRGGEIFAVDRIAVEEAGSSAGVPTVLGVSEKGEIKADRIHPNVNISVGPEVRRITMLTYRTGFSFKDRFVQKNY